MNTATLDPVIGLLLTMGFALLFVSAALHKLRDLDQFSEVLLAYQLPLPRGVLPPLLIPVLELAVAAGLLLPRTRALAAAAGASLLLLYAAGIALNLLRGRRDLACGCGGADDMQPIAAWMLWRNGLLALALLAVALARWSPRALTADDRVTLICALPALALLYLTFEQLLGRVMHQGALLREGP